MKRRSFLQAVGGAIAALFVPTVAAKAAEKYEFTQVLSPKIVVTNSARNDVWVDFSNDRPDYLLRKRGSLENPYRTILEAVNDATHNDIIMVKPAHIEQICPAQS